jgi:hypothetical protein
LNSPWIALVALVIFLAASALGFAVRPKLREHHKTRETMELLQVTVTMLVTFGAIVLGLLLTSAKANFDNADQQFRSYSIALIQLDMALRNYGPETDGVRADLRAYTAAAIASTWTGETPPAGNYYPHYVPSDKTDLSEESTYLGRMLREVNIGIRTLPAATAQETRDQLDCEDQMRQVFTQRWILISALQAQLSTPFLVVLTFWLTVCFLCIGLSAAFNPLAGMVILLSAVSLSSALFVIVDLNTLFDQGFFTISSQPERNALAQMLAPAPPMPQGSLIPKG